MPTVRLANGVLAAPAEEAWLAWPCGQPVAGAPRGSAPPPPGAPVVLGPRTSRPGAVIAALVALDDLLRKAGLAACGAGVDLGNGFRSGRLAGATEERRDAVFAALRGLGAEGAHRVGDRATVLTALCGPRATRRVGAALQRAAVDGRWAAIHLAVAASDVLGPEQLEQILELPEPAGADPIPGGLPSTLAAQLGRLLVPYTPPRRLTLLLDLWGRVLAHPARTRPPIRLMEGQLGEEHVADVLHVRRGVRDAWVLDYLAAIDGPRSWGVTTPWPQRVASAMWTRVPAGRKNPFAAEESRRLLADALAALALTATALAATRRPVTEALVANATALAMSIHPDAVPTGAADLDGVLAGPLPTPGRPGHLVARLAVAAVGATAWDFIAHFQPHRWAAGFHGDPRWTPPVGLFADCAGIFAEDLSRRDVARFARPLLAQAYAQGSAVLAELLSRFYEDGHPLPHGQLVARWARACASEVGDVAELGHRQPPYATCDCNGWWILALADNLADLEQRTRIAPDWHGGELPWDAIAGEEEEPDEEEDRASLGSVPGAVAAAAQLLQWGASAPARPGTWAELADGLWQGAPIGAPFQVPVEIADWHGEELPGSGLRIQVAHGYTDLNIWAAYMGNCIAGYAEEGESGECVLLALREADGTIAVNVDLHHGRSRWHVDEARERFNAALSPGIDTLLQAWVAALPRTRTLPGAEADAPPPPVRVVRTPRASGAAPARRPRPSPAVLTARQSLAVATEQHREACLSSHGGVLVEIATRLATHPPGDAEAAVIVLTRATPARLAVAVADCLAEVDLPTIWAATGQRPLRAALDALDASTADLLNVGALADAGPVSANLRAVANLDPIKRARKLENAQRAVRAALGTLLRGADPRFDEAIARRPRPGPVCAAILGSTLGLPISRHPDRESPSRSAIPAPCRATRPVPSWTRRDPGPKAGAPPPSSTRPPSPPRSRRSAVASKRAGSRPSTYRTPGSPVAGGRRCGPAPTDRPLCKGLVPYPPAPGNP